MEIPALAENPGIASRGGFGSQRNLMHWHKVEIHVLMYECSANSCALVWSSCDEWEHIEWKYTLYPVPINVFIMVCIISATRDE